MLTVTPPVMKKFQQKLLMKAMSNLRIYKIFYLILIDNHDESSRNASHAQEVLSSVNEPKSISIKPNLAAKYKDLVGTWHDAKVICPVGKAGRKHKS